MIWIYIWRCSDGHYYVGKTKQLYKRSIAHLGGNGGLNTIMYQPEEIVAIYKASILSRFFEYNSNINELKQSDFHLDFFRFKYGLNYGFLDGFNQSDDSDISDIIDELQVETLITERLMLTKPDWEKIHGGKYVRTDIEYKYPENSDALDLPNCHCRLPCDIKLNEELGYLFFRCAKKNMWNTFREDFEIDSKPCKFFKQYTNDLTFKNQWAKTTVELQKHINESDWLAKLINMETKNCLGTCCRSLMEIDDFDLVCYKKTEVPLCYRCFRYKYKILEKKYR